jgi:hypothetical protein
LQIQAHNRFATLNDIKASGKKRQVEKNAIADAKLAAYNILTMYFIQGLTDGYPDYNALNDKIANIPLAESKSMSQPTSNHSFLFGGEIQKSVMDTIHQLPRVDKLFNRPIETIRDDYDNLNHFLPCIYNVLPIEHLQRFEHVSALALLNQTDNRMSNAPDAISRDVLNIQRGIVLDYFRSNKDIDPFAEHQNDVSVKPNHLAHNGLKLN